MRTAIDAVFLPGALVAGRYRILRYLASGGMGSVYIAEHLGFGQPMALKILAPGLSSEDSAVRFEREAHAAARLNHPGCVRVFDFGRTEEGLRYLAMELLEGPTLAETLAAEGPLSIAHALLAARQILEALAHAHRAGVLHRDVKPENVMVAQRDGIKRLVLIDFGLARLRGERPLTALGHCFGSPSYTAPERLLGQSYDARADLYSVGVILYELLAGRRPFTGSSPLDIASRHVRERPAPLRAIRPDVPRALEALVDRSLAKDPAGRFPSAEAMLDAIRGFGAITLDITLRNPVPEALLAPPVEDDTATLVMAEIVVPRTSLLARLWSWLRYGAWRWSDRGATSTAAG